MGGSEVVFEEDSGTASTMAAVSVEVLDSLLIKGVNGAVSSGGPAIVDGSLLLPLLANDFLGETGGVTLCRGAVVSPLTTSIVSKVFSSRGGCCGKTG